jgi:AcrR family transcriptional regulator
MSRQVSVAGKRQYSSSLRDEQTALARHRILDAAGRLFIEHGYLGTTLAAIAKAAGVSVQTVYNVIGSKPALLKTLYDVQLAGDDEPIPMVQRPNFQAMIAARTARECLAAYAALGREIGERTMPLLRMAKAQASTGDADLTDYVTTVEAELMTGCTNVTRHVATTWGLRPGLEPQAAADILWSLLSNDLDHRLVVVRGWGWDRYESWLAQTLADLLLAPA